MPTPRPKTDKAASRKAALSELTTEQKERSDAEYVAAVNRGVAAAVKEADAGKLIPADEVWSKLGAKSAKR